MMSAQTVFDNLAPLQTEEQNNNGKHTHKPFFPSSLEMWGRWPACERLAMCCMEKRAFGPVGPYALKLQQSSIRFPLRLTHKHASLYQSRLHPHPRRTLLITDSSCIDEHNARAKAAQLASLPTWHWFDLWHVSLPPRKMLFL